MVEREHENALLSCADVRVTFGGIVALDSVSLHVAPGQILGIIGPNGAGKTTLFNCVSRLYALTSGDIRFAGQSIASVPRQCVADLGIARTFQNVALFETMTVRQNVLVGTHPLRVHSKSTGFLSDALNLNAKHGQSEQYELDEHAERMIERLGLTADADRYVSALPFGTRKRVEIARALASRPRLLMLDEPAGGLSHGDVDELRELIQALRTELNLTVLLVEHHMQFVMKLCDSIVALDFGRRIAAGTPLEIQNDPEVIRAYLGAAS